MVSGENKKALPLKSETRQGCLCTFANYITEYLKYCLSTFTNYYRIVARTVRQEEKKIQIEVNVSLFTKITEHIKDPKDIIRKLMNTFNKMTRHKINKKIST